MNKMLFAIAGLIVALAAACTGALVDPTAVSAAIPTATGVPQVKTPTPSPPQDWELQGISVAGTTVTVSLWLFAGIDVGVTVGGNPTSRVDAAIPVLEFVFEDVATGEHPVLISDIVGYSESASVTVETPHAGAGELPEWLAEWVANLAARQVEFPPQSITEYQHRGETVYHVVHQCCDRFSDLLDAGGNLIGHPDGGITGRGDGVTQFSPSYLKGEDIWRER